MPDDLRFTTCGVIERASDSVAMLAMTQRSVRLVMLPAETEMMQGMVDPILDQADDWADTRIRT
jgi:hypothetical protein